MRTQPAIALQRADLGYDGRELLGGLDLDVRPGGLLVVMGTNGSGKSTLLKTLAGLLPAVGGGRALAKEVLWVTSAVRAAIKNGNTHEIYQMIWQGSDQGMLTLEQDLARLVEDR